MGYSNNVSTVRNMAGQLQLLAAGQPCRWERPGKDGARWAYKIRECLDISVREVMKKGEHADELCKRLAIAKQHFTIRFISDTLVEASFKTEAEASLEPTPATQGMDPAGKPHTLGELKSLEDMMAVWKSRQPSNDPIHFPNALISDSDLALAADWAAGLKPPWMILRPKGTNSITLAPNDPRVPAGAKVKGSVAPKPRAATNEVEKLPPEKP